MYLWFPLSLRNVKVLLYERGIEVSHEAVRFWSRSTCVFFNLAIVFILSDEVEVMCIRYPYAVHISPVVVLCVPFNACLFSLSC